MDYLKQALACVATGMLLVNACAAGPTTEIRFYKANRQLQQDRIQDFRQGDEPGCHNFVKRPRVHRVAQIGFKHCVIYATRGCEAGTEVGVNWKEDKEVKTEMTPGARWFPVREDKRGTRVGSWECVPDEPAEPQ